MAIDRHLSMALDKRERDEEWTLRVADRTSARVVDGAWVRSSVSRVIVARARV
jgi:hypothetical protein